MGLVHQGDETRKEIRFPSKATTPRILFSIGIYRVTTLLKSFSRIFFHSLISSRISSLSPSFYASTLFVIIN